MCGVFKFYICDFELQYSLNYNKDINHLEEWLEKLIKVT